MLDGSDAQPFWAPSRFSNGLWHRWQPQVCSYVFISHFIKYPACPPSALEHSQNAQLDSFKKKTWPLTLKWSNPLSPRTQLEKNQGSKKIVEGYHIVEGGQKAIVHECCCLCICSWLLMPLSCSCYSPFYPSQCICSCPKLKVHLRQLCLQTVRQIIFFYVVAVSSVGLTSDELPWKCRYCVNLCTLLSYIPPPQFQVRAGHDLSPRR